MSDRLFEGSWYGTWQNFLRSATRDVEQLDRRAFSDPALAGQLQEIGEKHSLSVARLNKAGMEGKRRDTQREGADAWGDRRTFKQAWLDVTIPFTGDAESFKIAPSNCAIPSYPATVERNAITVTVPDDDNAERNVQTFFDQMSGNLERLRAEYEQSRPQLDQAIKQAADRRQQQIAVEQERNKKFSFR
jgi:hypothetical protein